MDMQHIGIAPRVQEARPPYIRFERRPVERRDVVGNVTWDDKDYILITPQGSKDVVEKQCDEYFPQLRRQVKDGQFPGSWYEAYTQTYKAWKEDQDPPIFGTSIRNWAAASPAEIKILTALGVVAVEDLAQANEEMIARIGMGGRGLKQRAKDYLEAANGIAPVVQRLEAAVQTIERLEFRMKEQDEELRILRITSAKGAQAQAVIDNSGLLSNLNDRLADAKAVADQSGPSEKELIDDVLNEVL